MTYIYRFYNRTTDAHFYTSDTRERNSLISSAPNMSYEGVAFTQPDTATAPVYRFYRTDTGTHFYTANAVERDYLNEFMGGSFRYEGQAFSASATQTTDSPQAVYRFYDRTTGVHFFTASDAERDSVIANIPSKTYEGIAYYTAAAPSKPTQSGAFDEDWYLQAYPDVRDAVSAGFTTAAKHYTEFGRAEGRLPNSPAAWTGNDTIVAAASAPGFGEIINGGAGNDVLVGGAGNDHLYGETGDDTLTGFQSDNLNGGSGDDTYFVGSASVTVVEGFNAGTDTVRFESGSYRIAANVERAYASTGEIWANDTGDYIEASFGGAVGGAATTVTIHGGAGNDTISAGPSGAVEGLAGDDYLTTRGRDSGGGFTNRVSLDGGLGNDTIAAVNGSDTMTGGGGNDTFLFSSDTFAAAQVGNSIITDFQAGADVMLFQGSTLTAQQIAGRFQDLAASVTGDQAAAYATFTASDFASAPAGTSFTLTLAGLSTAQITSSLFTVG